MEGLRRLIKLIVRCLDNAQPGSRQNIDVEIARCLTHGDGFGIRLSGGVALTPELVSDGERPRNHRAHIQVIRVQQLKRTLGLRDDRVGMVAISS